MGGELVVTDVPFLGPLREEWQVYICGFMLSLDDLHCDADATWHGFKLSEDGTAIKAMMECCDEHLPFIKRVSDYVHPLKHPCGIPGSKFRWPKNECYTEWSEQSEFAQVMAVTA